MLGAQAGDRACGVGKNPHLGWDQHMPLPAAHAAGHFQLVKLGMLPRAVLHWVDMGKVRIREPRETRVGGRGKRCLHSTPRTSTLRETETKNPLFCQHDGD